MENAQKTNIEKILPKDIILQLENLGIKNIEILKGDILDIGAGDGNLAKYLSQNINLKVTALDENPPEKPEFEIIKGDAKNLPFENESFDMIISHASIPNIFISLYSFEHPELSENEIRNAVKKSFNEIIRVLKKNGEVRISPVIMSDNYNSQKILKEIILSELESLRKDGYSVNNDFIRTEFNPSNKEKTDMYRIIIHKK